jgi:hypothetical protein
MTDRYTKIALTVISACLVVIAFRDLFPVEKATAQNGPVHVVVDQSGPLLVAVDSVAPFAFQNAGPLQVRQSLP